MKKSLILLPLFALVLTGCTLGGSSKKGGGGKKSSSSTSTDEPGEGGDIDIPDFGDYKQVTSASDIKEGGGYLFGIYDENQTHKFLTGTMDGYYPSCTASTADAAAKFAVEKSGDGYKLKVESGSGNSGKYMNIVLGDTKTDGSHYVNIKFEDSGVAWDWVSSETSYSGDEYTVYTLGIKLQPNEKYSPQYYVAAQQSGKKTLSATYNKHWADNAIGRLYIKK